MVSYSSSSDDAGPGFRNAAGASLHKVTGPAEIIPTTRIGLQGERIWVAVDWFLGGFEMPDHEREIYHSENGDRWLLCRADDGRTFVLDKANVSSGGKVTSIELGDFLRKGNRQDQENGVIGRS
jgi:hypothetical protein